MLSRNFKRGLIVGMLALVFLVLAYLLSVKTYDLFGVKTYGGWFNKKGPLQFYQSTSSVHPTTSTSRLSSFESTLKQLQQFGGNEVIFEGGKGFVRFRVRKDGALVVMVPVFASVPHISSTTLFGLILLSKRYYTIRLTSWEKEQLEQILPFQNAEERGVPYPKTDPHIFLEAELGTDTSAAAELAEAVLTKVFGVKEGMITTFAGGYRGFRSSAPLGQ